MSCRCPTGQRTFNFWHLTFNFLVNGQLLMVNCPLPRRAAAATTVLQPTVYQKHSSLLTRKRMYRGWSLTSAGMLSLGVRASRCAWCLNLESCILKLEWNKRIMNVKNVCILNSKFYSSYQILNSRFSSSRLAWCTGPLNEAPVNVGDNYRKRL